MFEILRKDNTFCSYMQTLSHFFEIFCKYTSKGVPQKRTHKKKRRGAFFTTLSFPYLSPGKESGLFGEKDAERE